MLTRTIQSGILGVALFLLSAGLSACGPTIISTQTALATRIAPTNTAIATGSPAPTSTPTLVPIPGTFKLRAQFSGMSDQTVVGDPDATIAVGPSLILAATNSRINILDKLGNVLASKSTEDFFAGVGNPEANNLTDPWLLYDPDSQRFFMANSDRINDPSCVPGKCVSYILLAVSRTARPMTLDPEDWYFYALDRTAQKTIEGTTYTSNFGDFDNLAVVGDILAISWDVDSFQGWLGPGGQVRFIDKGTLINGDSLTDKDWIDIVGLTGHVSINFGNPGRIFLVDRGLSEVRIWAVENPLTSLTLTEKSIPSLGFFEEAPDAAQPCCAADIDVLEGKVQSVYRNGYLWIARIIGRNFGSGDVAAIQWAQIDLSAWPAVSVVQSGILGTDGVWYYAPAIMVDESDNFAMIYARSSSTKFVSTYYTGRLATDAPNTLRPSSILNTGNVIFSRLSNGRNRFVDYFGIAHDPIDNSVWMMSLYPFKSLFTDTSASGTWIGNLDWTTVAGP